MFKQTQLVLFVSCSLMSCLQHATHFIGGKRKPYEFNSQIAFLHQGKIFRFPPVVPTPTQGFHIDAGSQHCWLRHGNIDWSHVFPGPRSRCTCQAVRGDCSSVPPAAPTFGQAPISQEYIWCVGDNHFGTCCAWTHSFSEWPGADAVPSQLASGVATFVCSMWAWISCASTITAHGPTEPWTFQNVVSRALWHVPAQWNPFNAGWRSAAYASCRAFPAFGPGVCTSACQWCSWFYWRSCLRAHSSSGSSASSITTYWPLGVKVWHDCVAAATWHSAAARPWQQPGVPGIFGWRWSHAAIPKIWMEMAVEFFHIRSIRPLHFGQLPLLSDKKLRDRSADVSVDLLQWFVFGVFVWSFFFLFPSCNKEVLTGRRRKQEFKASLNLVYCACWLSLFAEQNHTWSLAVSATRGSWENS